MTVVYGEKCTVLFPHPQETVLHIWYLGGMYWTMASLIFFDMALMSCVQNSMLIHSTDLPAAHIIRRRMIGCLVDNKSARIRN